MRALVDIKQTGRKLEKVRKYRGFTIKELSIAMKGVPEELIVKVEKGEFSPTLEYIFDFCNLLNVGIDEVVIRAS